MQLIQAGGTIFMSDHGIHIPDGTFSPTMIANCSLWLDADKGITLNGTDVTAWADESGNSKDAAQAVEANRPTYVASALNGCSCIRFNGTTDYLNLTAVTQTSAQMIFGVINSDVTTSSYRTFLGATGANAPRLYAGYTGFPDRPTVYDNNPRAAWTDPVNMASIQRYTLNATNSYISVDGGTNQTAVCLADRGTWTSIGAIPAAHFFDGDIHEIIIYDRVLSAAEINQVEMYLGNRYDLFLFWDATSIANCSLWLETRRGVTLVTGKVSAWADKSGNGNNFAQGTADNRPTFSYNKVHRYPSATLDGTNDFLSGSFAQQSAMTVFVVFDSDTTTSYRALLDGDALGSRLYAGYTGYNNIPVYYDNNRRATWTEAVTDPAIYRFTVNGTSNYVSVNGGTNQTGAGVADRANWNCIGAVAAGTGHFLDGELVEILIYDRVLTDLEIAEVELNLSRKYNISLE